LSFSILFQSKRKRPRTPTPGHYLGLKNTRDYGKFATLVWMLNLICYYFWYEILLNSIFCWSQGPPRGDRGRHRGGFGRDDYPYHRSPRRSPYRGGRDYSPRHSPYGGRYRRERSRSPYAPYGSPDRRYARGPRWYFTLVCFDIWS
jgi:transformer-2 protein